MIGNYSSLKNIEHYFLERPRKPLKVEEQPPIPKRPSLEKEPYSPTLNRLFSEHGGPEMKLNEAKLLLSKFQRFYEALQEPRNMTTEEEQAIKAKWTRFETTYNSPFLFDEFIASLRRDNPPPKVDDKDGIKVQKKARRSISQENEKKATFYGKSCRSVGKITQRNHKKSRIRSAVSEIRTILLHGEKFIKADTMH